jgi:hypothetical protein
MRRKSEIEQVVKYNNRAGLREGTIRPFEREGYERHRFDYIGGLDSHTQ